MRPLDPLRSIKTKLGVIIVGSLGAALLLVWMGLRAGFDFALVAVAAGALALAMVQLLAHGMTSPLREMARAVDSMSKGDYSTRVTATSRDEVGQLAGAFNAMAAELQQLDTLRRDLVANVSHELRTPISGLRAQLENLIDGVEPLDAASLKTMLTQVERLGRLVEQLLDLSRLEAGVIPLDLQRFDVGELIANAVKESKLLDPAVRFKTMSPPGLSAIGDPERVHQVVANLLENAIRHSPPQGWVSVSAHRNGDGIAIEVTDEGPGIPEGSETKVFERFYRSDASRSSLRGGAGLGLAIVRWIVDMHGGTIRVERNQPTGCRMVFSLPGAG